MVTPALEDGPTATLAAFADIIASHRGGSFLDQPATRHALTLSATPIRSGRMLESIYAPFDHIERGADLAIVGITPGAACAEDALTAARAALKRGADLPTAARQAKLAASFSGNVRANLAGMLDAVGAPGWFGIHCSDDLFGYASHQVHFTSALRNPVFVQGQHYTGRPNLLKQASLRAIVEDTLAAEVRALPNAWWLPLWDVPGEALYYLVAIGVLAPDRLLSPIPHPSASNGENVLWFKGTTSAAALSGRRASTEDVLLKRRDNLQAFFATRDTRPAIVAGSLGHRSAAILDRASARGPASLPPHEETLGCGRPS